MSYRVVRFYSHPDKPAKTIAPLSSVTLAEAKAHCLKTSSRGPVECGDFPDAHTIPQTADTKPSYCPICGVATVSTWFDGFTSN